MRGKARSFLFSLVAISASTFAGAGTVEPELGATLQSAAANDSIPVIVRLNGSVDIASLRDDFRTAADIRIPAGPDRANHLRTLKRTMLVHRLKDEAVRTRQPVMNWLRQQGVDADIRQLWSINAIAVSIPAEKVAELAALPAVEKVVLDAIVQGAVPAAVPTAPTNWNLDAVSAPDVWDLGFTGQGIVVGSMDSGVDATHPDLAPRYRGGTNSWFDPNGEHAEPFDPIGHGTQVMGLIVGGEDGGFQIGVAPDAQWISAKIFNDANEASLSAIHQAFQWMLDPDNNANTDDAPDIVNNSWVLANTINECNAEFTGDISLLKEAGIAVVFSAGNFGPDANTSVTPANDVGSLPVGSVDELGNISLFSSRGASACDGGLYPQLVAPGENLLTAEPAPSLYNVVSGSSYSAAHVSGAMALLKSAFPDASAGEMESALQQTATDLGDPGPDDTFGYGMINVAAAYDWLVNNNADQPGTLSFSAVRYQVPEGNPSVTITVSRSSGTTGTIGVDYTTRDETALAGEDYTTVSGTLTFLDGETSQTFTVPIIDDTVVEGAENFQVLLSNATGGARLGAPTTSAVDIADDDDDNNPPPPPPPGGEDVDGDGFNADVDCNDNDASISPAAIEIARDGIDQNCDGYDLTIEITLAKFQRDKVYVRATTDLNSEAALEVTFILADGTEVKRPMSWKSKHGHWQKSISRFSYRIGSHPVRLRVAGIEGEVSADVKIVGRVVE